MKICFVHQRKLLFSILAKMALSKAHAFLNTWKKKTGDNDLDTNLYMFPERVDAVEKLMTGLRKFKTNTSDIFLCQPAEVILAFKKVNTTVDGIALREGLKAIGRTTPFTRDAEETFIVTDGSVKIDVRNPVTDGVLRMLNTMTNPLQEPKLEPTTGNQSTSKPKQKIRDMDAHEGLWKCSDLDVGDNVLLLTLETDPWTFEIPDTEVLVWIAHIEEKPTMESSAPNKNMMRFCARFYLNTSADITQTLTLTEEHQVVWVKPEAVLWVFEAGELKSMNDKLIKKIQKYVMK